MNKQYVYILRMGNSNLYKIGKAINVAARVKDLQTSCPDKLSILAAFGGVRESELHQRQKGQRRHGEWFELSDDQVRDLVAWAGAKATSWYQEPTKKSGRLFLTDEQRRNLLLNIPL